MVTTLLAGLSILVIGDSHLISAGNLIDSLHMGLEGKGARVHTVGACGTEPSDWLAPVKSTCGAAERVGKGPVKILAAGAEIPSIQTLLAREKPRLLLIVMGDTLASYPKPSFPKAWAWQQVSALTKAVSATGTACLWIGPAWGQDGGKYGKTDARVKLVSAFLAGNVAPCGYIDSLKLSRPGAWTTVDGVHFNRAGYAAWGHALTQQLEQSPVLKTLEKR
ncbi:SGNH/GDSL hydrolase family protein [Castellaniella defragrans]|uniref:SGNH/GDSL hydrolase family protein n=1 Tax=Castellaniella defragrans TaxID=75697 RepID=A0A7W9WLP7_CASDE|nr:SGNH/GDSL hydrolase family protein [Castellaniella defragrans]KAB0622440.1 SGNH/GDSL hydrolase family protein [Castellaniella defragrans]MBB6083467.1 hypothetical protein [Castellaniella defragrans]